MLLELAIWKSKMTDQDGQNTADMKMPCRADSLLMITIIVLNVLSFLLLMVMVATMCWIANKIGATITMTTMVNDDDGSYDGEEDDDDDLDGESRLPTQSSKSLCGI
jgi:hypothetical protein